MNEAEAITPSKPSLPAFSGLWRAPAPIFHVCVWLLGVELLAGPWILGALGSLGFHKGIHPHPLSPLRGLLVANVFGLCLLARYQSMYRSLSERIRQSSPDVQYFERLRLSLATMVLSFEVLIIAVMVHVSSWAS